MMQIIHAGFALMLVAQAIRNILLLRVTLIMAQGIFIAYGVVSTNYSVAVWNGLFILINIFQAIVLLRQKKPVTVPPDIRDIYEKVFPEMTKREFLYFWQIGKVFQLKRGRIIEKGRHQDRVLLILEGQARVLHDRREIAVLSRGDFIAEMSFLTGEPASADVRCRRELTCIAWSRDNLVNLKKLNHQLWSRLQHVLSKDLVGKMKKISARLAV